MFIHCVRLHTFYTNTHTYLIYEIRKPEFFTEAVRVGNRFRKHHDRGRGTGQTPGEGRLCGGHHQQNTGMLLQRE